jgi:ankyrin repeat protein
MSMSLANFIINASAKQLKAQLPPGVDLDEIDEYGYTPLIQCAIVNDADKAKVILDAGADVNVADLTGRSALHWAVDNDNFDLIELLLHHKANPNAYAIASQPAGVKPYLRKNTKVMDALLNAGADLTFIKDYVNTKLLGHRFELTGFVDILDADKNFTELTYEGFILEFSIDLIRQSLSEYQNNYAARQFDFEFKMIKSLIAALDNANKLASYQHYLLDVLDHKKIVKKILKQDLVIIPIGQEGHAITLIRYKNIVAICDRAEQKDPNRPSVRLFYMNRPSKLNIDLLKVTVYKRSTIEALQEIFIRELSLQVIDSVDLSTQLMGNCSWANVEACLPVFKVMSAVAANVDKATLVQVKKDAKYLYRHWREWDKERALQFCLQDFPAASPARKASKVAVLAAIFVQSCRASRAFDLRRAERIYPILNTPGYEYVLQSYMTTYCNYKTSPVGDNLKRLLQILSDADDFID